MNVKRAVVIVILGAVLIYLSVQLGRSMWWWP